MNDYINLKTESLKQNLINLINNSELPVANAYFVIKHIEHQIEKTYLTQIRTEQQQLNEENTSSNPQENEELFIQEEEKQMLQEGEVLNE